MKFSVAKSISSLALSRYASEHDSFNWTKGEHNNMDGSLLDSEIVAWHADGTDFVSGVSDTVDFQSWLDAHDKDDYDGILEITSTGTDVNPPDDVDEITTSSNVTVTLKKQKADGGGYLTSATDTVYLSVSTPGFAIKNEGGDSIASVTLSSGEATFKLHAPADLRVECELRCYIGSDLKGTKKFISISA